MDHPLKRVWDKNIGEAAFYCDTCEVVYKHDSVRAGVCPSVLGVTCNRCLADMLKDEGTTYGLPAEFSTGYSSTALEDGYVYRFNLCEACIVDLFKTFERAPERRAYMGGEPGEHNWHDDHQFKRGEDH